MASAGTTQGKSGVQPVLPADLRADSAASITRSEPKRFGYGLPCSNCGTYYTTDKSSCPVCKCDERVSPTLAKIPATIQAAEPLPMDHELEEERERFLREFRAQLLTSQVEVHETTSFGCTLEHNHDDDYEAATICRECYGRAQERADQLEAALHMDVKEATQIIYEAVWADPSDPSKTYHNAAQAILSALRQRAGVETVLSTIQPYSH
jgi:hypothetical protein